MIYIPTKRKIVKILLLEDDTMLNELISERLAQLHDVKSLSDGEIALECAYNEKFDLLLLDVDVPNVNGFELLELLRNANITTPAIFITAKTASKDLKLGFEVGGSDYIRKPFDFDELEARISNICKLYHIGNELDLGGGYVLKERYIINNDTRIHIGHKESEILEYLAKNKDRFISSEELSTAVWRGAEAPSHATIRTYVKNIRHLLGADSITTEKGFGWRFDGV